MAEDSVPDIERIAALATEYANAHYFATLGRREWLFQIGHAAADIERQLLAKHYLFITAWNPASRHCSEAENRAAGDRLQARLLQSGYTSVPALGCDADGGAVEPGRLVLDVPLARADALAREFGQLGILYWPQGQPVRLRMLAPRPPRLAGYDHIDWAG